MGMRPMQIRVDPPGRRRAQEFNGDSAMKFMPAMLCTAWFTVVCGGMAIAQDTKPAPDAKPAAITVLEDASPVMYGRSAKIKATVEAIDLDVREITLKGPKGRLITLRVEQRVRNLPQAQVGDEVIVRYHESVGLELHKIEASDAGAFDETAAAGADTRQNQASGAARQFTVAAHVEAVSPKAKTVTLRGPNGDLVDLYVRDLNVLESLAAGDNVVATYTEAAAVSIELPKKKEKPKPKKKKQTGASENGSR
jgi:Cu/Ag efflux protein CusF